MIMSFISPCCMRIIVRLNSSEYIQLNVTLTLLPRKRGHYTIENYFGSLRVRLFQSRFFNSFKLYPEASSGWRFDRAYYYGAEERTKKLWEPWSSRSGVLIIINRRTYCFGCPSRRRSVSRAAVGAKSLLYYVIKTGNLTAANGKSPTAAAAATTVTRSMASNYYYRV